ncbi:MAG: NADH-quinone oxidoreductase subunit NuoH [Chloroflexi bacterium]|nr:NADH-quinone oxidoreductase subunit NuoH [Chloroflexota bacterium]
MDWLRWIIFVVIILAFALSFVMAFILLERRIVGKFQLRPGPNRVGPMGMLQPVADAVKILLKEDITPAKGDRWVHRLAPIVAFAPALLVFAVVPFQGKGPGLGFSLDQPAALADLNVGVLYIVAVSSISVIGMIMAGWASNNKYSLLGAMRAIAQMVSYEVPLVLSIVGIVIASGSLSLNSIVEAQSIPFILLQPLGFLIYFLGATAEINRAPFDLLEAESEIVASYHTEYSGMRFAMFFLGEYAYALGVSAIVSVLFLGGYKFPFGLLPQSFIWFLAKIFLVFFLMLWVRSTLPRVRIDQMMAFAWKFLLPLSLVNLLLVAAEGVSTIGFGWAAVGINVILAIAFVVIWANRFYRVKGVTVG